MNIFIDLIFQQKIFCSLFKSIVVYDSMDSSRLYGQFIFNDFTEKQNIYYSREFYTQQQLLDFIKNFRSGMVIKYKDIFIKHYPSHQIKNFTVKNTKDFQKNKNFIYVILLKKTYFKKTLAVAIYQRESTSTDQIRYIFYKIVDIHKFFPFIK